MNRSIFILLTVVVLAGCSEKPAMTTINFRNESLEIEKVKEVLGVGFDPYDDPSKSTNALITGSFGRLGGAHHGWARIMVHNDVVFSLEDRSGQLHTPKVTILGKVPGKKDYGQVDIVIKGPEEVVVTVGERPASPK